MDDATHARRDAYIMSANPTRGFVTQLTARRHVPSIDRGNIVMNGLF
jgi:hypothetical protein